MHQLICCQFKVVHFAVNLLSDASTSAKKNLWWPFTQHSTVLKDSVTVIDSRCGEEFAVYQPGTATQSVPRLQMQYDACASWWTQVKSVLNLLVGYTYSLPIGSPHNAGNVCGSL